VLVASNPASIPGYRVQGPNWTRKLAFSFSSSPVRCRKIGYDHFPPRLL